MKKKYLIIFLALTLALGTDATAAQARRHHPATAQAAPADSAATPADELEAFSDTTGTHSTYDNIPFGEDDEEDDDLFGSDDAAGTSHTAHISLFDHFSVPSHDDWFDLIGLLGMLGLAALIFAGIPFLILAFIFYLIYKNRKQRMQFAEQAMKNGQPIPDGIKTPRQPTEDELWNKGLKQVFLGLGLAVFLGMTAGRFGFGIGILVLCIGAGNLFIARNARHSQGPHSTGNTRNTYHNEEEEIIHYD